MKKQKKIGINASFVRKPETGIGQVTQHFIEELFVQEGWSSSGSSDSAEYQFTLYVEEELKLSLPDNFTQHIFQPFWGRDDLLRKIWWEKWLLHKRVSSAGCDAFVSLYQSPTILPAEIAHIMVVHDIIPLILPEYLDNVRKKYYYHQVIKGIKSARKIIAVSKRTEKDLIQKLGVSPGIITTTPIDVDPIFKQLVSQENEKKVREKFGLTKGYIYYGGGLDTRKNVELVIGAYDRLLTANKKGSGVLEEVPDLVISGALYPQMAPLITDVEAKVKERHLEDRVHILGKVDQSDLPSLYRGAAVFVFPSRYEGFGLPVLEAINIGIPTITSKTSSLPEVGGDAVLYCDPEDKQDLAKLIAKVLTHEDIREELRQRSQQRSQRFSWESFVGKVMCVADELVL